MDTSNPIELTAEIVAAFVSNNPLPKGELPSLIHAVHMAVVSLGAGPESAQSQIEVKEPAVRDCHGNSAPAERESKGSALVQAAVAARQF
jgi:predicted transcriptional regulator